MVGVVLAEQVLREVVVHSLASDRRRRREVRERAGHRRRGRRGMEKDGRLVANGEFLRRLEA